MPEAVTKYAVNNTLGDPNFKPLNNITKDSSYECFYNVMSAIVSAYGDNEGSIKVEPLSGFEIDDGSVRSTKVVILSPNASEIRSSMFNASPIENIVIPNSVTSIGYRAFLGCYNLKGIKIPYGIRTIDETAFEGCHSLTDIYVEKRSDEIIGAPWGATKVNVHFTDKIEYFGE